MQKEKISVSTKAKLNIEKTQWREVAKIRCKEKLVKY